MQFRNAMTLIISLGLFPLSGRAQQTTLSPATDSGRSTVYAPNAVIATSQPLATSAGLEVMRAGGNAIDAAIAAAAVLNLTEPHMTGIGGDMFALLWSEREGGLVGMNAAGPAGSLMTRDEIIRRGHDDVPGSGPEAVTVPGALARVECAPRAVRNADAGRGASARDPARRGGLPRIADHRARLGRAGGEARALSRVRPHIPRRR